MAYNTTNPPSIPEKLVELGFKRIPSAPNYAICPDGMTINLKTYRELNPFLNGNQGLRNTYFAVAINGGPKNLHSLILETFVGPRPPRHRTRFKDGNKYNFHLSNLQWVSSSEPPTSDNLLQDREERKRNAYEKREEALLLLQTRRQDLLNNRLADIYPNVGIAPLAAPGPELGQPPAIPGQRPLSPSEQRANLMNEHHIHSMMSRILPRKPNNEKEENK